MKKLVCRLCYYCKMISLCCVHDIIVYNTFVQNLRGKERPPIQWGFNGGTLSTPFLSRKCNMKKKPLIQLPVKKMYYLGINIYEYIYPISHNS